MKTTKAKTAKKKLYVQGCDKVSLRCAVRNSKGGTLAHVLAMHPVPCSIPTLMRINTRCSQPLLHVSYPADMSAHQRAATDKALTWAIPLPLAHSSDTDGVIDVAIGGVHVCATAARRLMRAILRGDLDNTF